MDHNNNSKNTTLRGSTIADFGHQWTTYKTNDGFYGSTDLLQDILNPFLTLNELRGLSIAEIGSGTGRIVGMLSSAGAAKITAIEPSEAFDVLCDNTKHINTTNVTCVRDTGEAVGRLGPFDLVVSIGVLHHIPDPAPVCQAAFNSLAPRGQFFIWVYGSEGNALFLTTLAPLRWLRRLLPHSLLPVVVWILFPALKLYLALCRIVPLPLYGYMRHVIGLMSPDKQRLVIYDQLNPTYSKYYRREEAEALLCAAGFENVRVHHRHGYSWTLIGSKPPLAP